MLGLLVPAIALLLPGQRYAVPATTLAPVEMHASCAPDARVEVDQGAAWLQVLAPREARQAFDRAADADPDCALAYWGRAASFLPVDGEVPTAEAMTAGAAALVRARAVPIGEPHERALIEALAPVFLTSGSPSRPALALPARLRQYRDGVCAARGSIATRALAVFCARAAWLGSTLPGDAASVDATRIIAEAFGEASLTVGAAVVLLQADAAKPALLTAAAGTIQRHPPPAPAPFHLACRAFVRTGEWARAVEVGEAALARASPLGVSTLVIGERETTLAEWLLDAYLQQGRRSDARRLLTSTEMVMAAAASEAADAADVPAVPRSSVARLQARWLVTSRDAPAPEPAPVRAEGPPWVLDFARGLRAAVAAWPGPIPERVAEAKEARSALARAQAVAPHPEIELAAVLIDAALAASQDEHQSLELLITHAADLERRLLQTRRDAWPFIPARELASELCLRAYRDADAIRDARAVLAEFPNRARPWLVIARAAARLKRGDEAAAAYTTLLEIRKAADAGDAEVAEARAYVAARPAQHY